MTAPLPPMPEPEHEIRHETDGYVTAMHSLYSERTLQAYAKLTAREALKRAAVAAWSAGMNEHNKAAGLPCDARTTGSRCAETIRAMLEEYK